MFSGCTMLPDSMETEPGSSNQEALPSVTKNAGEVLLQCHAWKNVLTTISCVLDISEVPGCHLLYVSS